MWPHHSTTTLLTHSLPHSLTHSIAHSLSQSLTPLPRVETTSPPTPPTHTLSHTHALSHTQVLFLLATSHTVAHGRTLTSSPAFVVVVQFAVCCCESGCLGELTFPASPPPTPARCCSRKVRSSSSQSVLPFFPCVSRHPPTPLTHPPLSPAHLSSPLASRGS